MKHELQEIRPGHSVSICTFDDRMYFIGVQLAALLKRETFNLYRSMKIRNVAVSRATHEQILFLLSVGAVRPGTRSLTLLDYTSCSAFIQLQGENLPKKSASQAKGKRHYSELAAWHVPTPEFAAAAQSKCRSRSSSTMRREDEREIQASPATSSLSPGSHGCFSHYAPMMFYVPASPELPLWRAGSLDYILLEALYGSSIAEPASDP